MLKRYSALLVIFGSALWGTDALFRRPLTGTLSPVTIVLLEHCVLCLVLFPVVWGYRNEFLRLKGRDYAALLFIALGGSVAATSLFTFSMKYGNPSVVILLQKTQPLFTVILARVALGERPAKWFWPWFAAAIAGAYLISDPDWQHGVPFNPGHPAIVFSALAAAGLWGSATVCGRFMVSRISIPFLTALRCVFALPALMVLYWLQPANQRTFPVGLSPLLNLFAMALIAGLAALLLYYKGLQFTPASVASVCELSFPITAVALNWLVLEVRLSALQLAGSVILIASVTCMTVLNARKQDKAASAGSKPIDS
jgi:drug/metabolite transporter (DMT)-like permease